MTTREAVVAVERLTKRYGRRLAVADLSVDVPRGVVAGFIGPNGAGKTTTMAMLLGLVRPTSGHATVLGEPITRPERYLDRVGALVEGPALWPGLTGVENLRVLARLGNHAERQIPELLDLVGLAERGHDRFGHYSLGMKQRVAVAAALLGDPELLVLDEPTNGLDPAGMTQMRALIGRLATADRTVLVSSHLLSELEQVCTWLLIIDRGQLVYAGDSAGFAARSSHEIVLEPVDLDLLLSLADVVASLGLETGRDGDRLVVSTEGRNARDLAAQLNRAAAASGIVLAEVHTRRPTLETSYFELLGGDSR